MNNKEVNNRDFTKIRIIYDLNRFIAVEAKKNPDRKLARFTIDTHIGFWDGDKLETVHYETQQGYLAMLSNEGELMFSPPNVPMPPPFAARRIVVPGPDKAAEIIRLLKTNDYKVKVKGVKGKIPLLEFLGYGNEEMRAKLALIPRNPERKERKFEIKAERERYPKYVRPSAKNPRKSKSVLSLDMLDTEFGKGKRRAKAFAKKLALENKKEENGIETTN